MKNANKYVLKAILSNDFKSFCLKCFETLNPGTPFIDNWHIDAACEYARKLRTGEIKRGIVSMPPRSMKSEIFTVYQACYILGENPSAKIAIVAYAKELSAEFSMKIRSIIQSDWYQEVFPSTRLSRNLRTQSDDFYTDKHGQIYATSIDGTITGKGYNYIFVDDPLKAENAFSTPRRNKVLNWFSNTLPSRVNNLNEGVITLTQQRLHSNDPVGYLLDQGGWDHFCLSAVAHEDIEVPLGDNKTHLFKEGEFLNPKMLGEEALERLKIQMGSHRFAAQYMQKPVPEEGELIPMGSFKRYRTAPLNDPNHTIYQSWDIAATTNKDSDYSVGTTWLVHHNKYYLLDVIRAKLEFNALGSRIVTNANDWSIAATLIEKSSVGEHLIQALKAASNINLIEIIPKGDKISRMVPCTADIEAGYVVLPEDEIWLPEFESELAAFPNGKHDDQADSFSQFLNWIRKSRFSDQEIEKQIEIAKSLKEAEQGPQTIKTDSDLAKHLWGRRPTP